MDSIWITLFSLILVYLVVNSVRQRLHKYRLRQDFKVVDDDILKRVLEDIELFDRAYIKTFQAPEPGKARVEIRDLVNTKQRVLKNLNIALRRLPNDIPSEESFRKNIEKVDYAMCAKIDDVRKRYKQGYWPGPIGDYFFKQVQKGRRDISQSKPATVVTKMCNDPIPILRQVVT